MAATSTGKFSCDGCGKSYAWKTELAGRRVKCKCGQTMTVPKEDPAAAAAADLPPGFDDLYALSEGTPLNQDIPVTPPPIARAGGGTCPSCGAGIDAGAALCASCGHTLKVGKKAKAKTAVAESAAGDAMMMV